MEGNGKMAEYENFPKSIAIIMDGNRRWAKKNNLNTALGHKKGAETVEKISRYCNKIGVKYLTVYAFSTENWKRSKDEVTALMVIFGKYLDRFLKNADYDNIKLKMVGDTHSDIVPKILQNKMENLEKQTEDNTGMQLNICFNYGGRAEIVNATKKIAKKVKDGEIDIDDIDEKLFASNLYTVGTPDPDLLIRTSGELRTSNFLPWQITYSEFIFLDKFWPEFSEDDVDNCIKEYEKRQRRRGK